MYRVSGNWLTSRSLRSSGPSPVWRRRCPFSSRLDHTARREGHSLPARSPATAPGACTPAGAPRTAVSPAARLVLRGPAPTRLEGRPGTDHVAAPAPILRGAPRCFGVGSISRPAQGTRVPVLRTLANTWLLWQHETQQVPGGSSWVWFAFAPPSVLLGLVCCGPRGFARAFSSVSTAPRAGRSQDPGGTGTGIHV